MIGDSNDSDILGAQNSGIDQIYFNPRIEVSENDKPTYRVRSLEEIIRIL
jgi:putative hydrolase of the HAD superfamily